MPGMVIRSSARQRKDADEISFLLMDIVICREHNHIKQYNQSFCRLYESDMKVRGRVMISDA